MMKFFRRFQDLGIEGEKARHYDRLTRKHRIGEMREYAKEAAKHLRDGDSVLEIAPGAGYLSIELSRLGNYRLTGMDISKDLVEICNRNANEAGVEIDFREGNVSRMPFRANTFDFVICVLAFKNFKEPIKALGEMHRVLRQGGTALIIDLNRDATIKATKRVAENMGLKGIMAYVAAAIQRSGSYRKNEFVDFISRTEFRNHGIRESDTGFSIYLSK